MKIGVIGGGQLGMMIAQSAILLGHEILSLDPNDQCPISKYSTHHITAEYSDENAIQELCKNSDVVTYEFENVDVELVEKHIHKIPQKSKALFITQNRLREKSFVKELEIPVPNFYKYEKDNINNFPVIIKTTTGGYDGKGQHVFRSKSDIDHIYINNEIEYIVEEFIEFDFEISVVLTRDTFGTIKIQPTTRNEHRDGILFISKSCYKINPNALRKAKEYSMKIIAELDYIGTMAVEYFVKGDDVIFNEYAPRPHNSGHFSIEGTTVSQFHNHVLAITGKNIKSSDITKCGAMINILGQNILYVERAKNFDEAFVHMYNKKKIVHNRKMGHITLLSNDQNELDLIIDTITKE